MSDRYRAADLLECAATLFRTAGLDQERAATTATYLLEGDLMGHTTHGLALCAPYLSQLEQGGLNKTGEPRVISDTGTVFTWDARRLPGVWLTVKALQQVVERALKAGVAAGAIHSSGHIACLQAFLPIATDAGCMAIITSSDPSVRSVAPFGGIEPQFTPNPLAAGIPTDGDPLLIDISASITTNGMVGRHRAQGTPLPGKWLLDNTGHVTDDPEALTSEPPGSILPIGGVEYGHKGFALALIIEALTQGLSGFGRVDRPTEWGAGVFIQVLAPAAFGGEAPFRKVMGYLASACRQTAPQPGFDSVRMPGDRGLALKRRALEEGLELYPGIIESLREWGSKLGVTVPGPITAGAG